MGGGKSARGRAAMPAKQKSITTQDAKGGGKAFAIEGTEAPGARRAIPLSICPIYDYIVARYNILRIIISPFHRRMKKLTLNDYRALAEFRYQIRTFLHFSDRAVEAKGLERGQYQLMLAIKGAPPGERTRIRDVANRMQIQHHSAVELINRLERGGYVERERGLEDRREVFLELTAKGERVLAELALHHHEELKNAAPKLVAALRRVTVGKNGR